MTKIKDTVVTFDLVMAEDSPQEGYLLSKIRLIYVFKIDIYLKYMVK